MSLAERIAAAKRDRGVTEAESNGEALGSPTPRTRRVGDPFADLKRAVHQTLLDSLGPKLYDSRLTQSDLEQKVRSTLQEVLAQDDTPLTVADRARIAQEIADDILGYGPLEPFLRDPDVTEVMVNGPDSIYIERAGRLFEVAGNFTDEAHLRRTIDKIVARVGRRVDEASPMVDARLPDGSRVNAVIPPLSLSGPLITIRKFSRRRLTLDDMIKLGTLDQGTVEFLQRCIRAQLNMLISGGTGSGKTTLMNALSTAIPDEERIVTIEDAAELRLNQTHVLRLESRPKDLAGENEIPIRMLVRNSLRMRPDRIIVGEVRGAEALDMLQAMNTGHDGSLSTIHSNTPRDALARVETMVLMAGYDLPVRAIREQVSSALECIVHLERVEDGSRRLTSITEVQGMESDVITLQELFKFQIDEVTRDGTIVGGLRPTGLRPTFLEKFEKRGIALPLGLFQGHEPEFGTAAIGTAGR